MTEAWRLIEGYPKYAVSDMGRIANVETRTLMTPQKQGRPEYPQYAVIIRNDDGKKNFLVHRLVLEAFVGPRPEGMFGCHNNGDPSDNRLENLRWDTPKNNSADMIRHGTNHYRNLTHCKRGHLLEDPNLTKNGKKTNHRKCRACATTYAAERYYIGKGKPFDFQEYSDKSYERFINAESSSEV